MSQGKKLDIILDALSMEQFGRKRSVCLKNKICVRCGVDCQQLKDASAKKVFLSNALCPKCQNRPEGEWDLEEKEPKALWC